MTELNGPNLEGVTGKKFWVLLKRRGAHLQLKIFYLTVFKEVAKEAWSNDFASAVGLSENQ